MNEPYPSRALDKIVVRVPDGMRDQIAAAAKANGRSMNSEIVHRLGLSLSADATAQGIDVVPPQRMLVDDLLRLAAEFQALAARAAKGEV
jgi:hypothetical protein